LWYRDVPIHSKGESVHAPASPRLRYSPPPNAGIELSASRAALREAAPTVDAQWSCAPPPDACPDLLLDPQRCIEVDGLLVPDVVDGIVVDARLDAGRLAQLALPDGSWWSRVADPDGGCSSLVVTFSTDEATLASAQPLRHEAATPVAASSDGPRVDDDFVVEAVAP
jgi:hypothetical protein